MIYKTAQIAKLIGVHPNTIRFYEEMELLPAIPRTASGYRVFSDRHLEQLRLLRTAFRAEIISDRLRQEVLPIVKTAAADELDGAYQGTQKYLKHLQKEQSRAEEAIRLTLDIIENGATGDENVFNGRRKAAETPRYHDGCFVRLGKEWPDSGSARFKRIQEIRLKRDEQAGNHSHPAQRPLFHDVRAAHAESDG
ncbi:MAG TPA: hypothetical protein DER33_05660 [Syntrophomonas sp.]|nr:hypothetical protein [Syntrophomonas sp.]